jgi:hypothetical protein
VTDVFLAALLVRAVLVTSWPGAGPGASRDRFAPAASILGLALWALLAGAGWYGRGADALGQWGAVLLVFLGPSVVPGATDRVPLSGLLAAHPIAARLLVCAVLVLGFVTASRHAGRVSPLSDEAVRRQGVALAILAPALLVGITALCLGLGAAFSD